MRWNKQVADGLNLIYGYMDNEWSCRQWSAIECTTRDEEGEPMACGKCEGCRNHAALGKALSWLDRQINKRSR